MKYTPRLTAPGKSDKNWLHYSSGGYNYCIKVEGNSCLPNCVGYAWGRWRELLGKYHNLSRGNAENWWGNTGDGYKRGQEPKVGAVICWRKGQAGNGSDGAGHVGIVEEVKADGSIVVSASGYKSTYFYTKTYKPPYSNGSAYTFQGFIYIPLDFDEPTTNKDLTTEVLKPTAVITMEVLRQNSSGPQVKTLQRLLSALGYSCGTIDGSFGPKTLAALKKYQGKVGLGVDGICGIKTWNKLLKG